MHCWRPLGVCRRGDVVQGNIKGSDADDALATCDRQVSRMRDIIIGLKVTEVGAEIVIRGQFPLSIIDSTARVFESS